MAGNISSIMGGPWSPPPPKQYDAPEIQLANAIREAGYEPPSDIRLDGKLRRFWTGGNRKKKTGWCIAWDGAFPAGSFGDWRENSTITWRAEVGRDITDADRIVISRRMAEARAIRDAEQKLIQEAVADVAETIWENCLPASADHPYLVAKGVGPHGIRVTSDGRVVVPMMDNGGEIISLQYIDHEGNKLYANGGKVAGARYLLGEVEGGTIYIAEGFATAASIYEATGNPTYVAFSKAGLSPVAADLRAKHGVVQDIVIVADNDPSGDGEKYARLACETHSCRFVMPPTLGDANDYEGDLAALLAPRASDWLVHADDFSSQPSPVKWLVKKWLQDGSFMMVHGPSGGGKTFIVLDWCMRIASQINEWNGNKVKNGNVLYLAGEGHHGLRARIAAWKLHNNQSRLNMWVSKSGCDMNKDDGYQRVAESVRALGEVPSLIVVDTLHRFLDGNENDTQDARTMIIACGKLMDEFGCAVLLVHHTGVNEEAQHRARGSSAWRAAMDIEISVVPTDSGQRKVTQKKVKDGEECEPVFVDLLPVELPGWLDEDGDQVSSVVPVIGDAPPPPAKKDSKLDSFKKLFEAAWWGSGAEEVDGYPYVSRSAMIAHLVTSNGQSEASAKQNVKPSETQRLIGSLLVSEIILPESHGWRVQDGVFSSALLMRKNG